MSGEVSLWYQGLDVSFTSPKHLESDTCYRNADRQSTIRPQPGVFTHRPPILSKMENIKKLQGNKKIKMAE